MYFQEGIMNNKLAKPRLQIIRGLPGSGKTTLALDRYSHLMRIETDMFFMRDGKYTFTLDLNKKAVKWFNKTVRDMAKTGMDFVVTGVFAAHTERLATTIAAGLDNGYEVYIKTLARDYGNIHNVPQDHLKAMKDSFVSDRKLKKVYEAKEIHFGLMPRGFKV
jgi:predicted ABC-type ATPase